MVEEKGNCSAKGKCKFYMKPPNFCEIGYTQNPKTEEATRNAIYAGAEICNQNPHKWDIKKGR